MLSTRPICAADAEVISAAFAAIGWNKPAAVYSRYLEEQASGRCWVRVAEWKGEVAGYVTVAWTSPDQVLRQQRIPEIMDLNVLPRFRRLGIGGALLAEAEAAVSKRSNEVGIRVGLHSGYGAAQRIYIRRGYVPDGSGAVINGVCVAEGALISMGDDVTLRLTKQLPRK